MADFSEKQQLPPTFVFFLFHFFFCTPALEWVGRESLIFFFVNDCYYYGTVVKQLQKALKLRQIDADCIIFAKRAHCYGHTLIYAGNKRECERIARVKK